MLKEVWLLHDWAWISNDYFGSLGFLSWDFMSLKALSSLVFHKTYLWMKWADGIYSQYCQLYQWPCLNGLMISLHSPSNFLNCLWYIYFLSFYFQPMKHSVCIFLGLYYLRMFVSLLHQKTNNIHRSAISYIWEVLVDQVIYFDSVVLFSSSLFHSLVFWPKKKILFLILFLRPT